MNNIKNWEKINQKIRKAYVVWEKMYVIRKERG